jgi:protein involved in polysaccharide export with SLBB domain
MFWSLGPLWNHGRPIWCWPSLALLLWLAGAVAVAQPTDSDYKLGPGDRIGIRVFGEDDLSMDVRINDTGRLNYPFVGELVVQGLTVAELEQLITRGLKGSYLRNPTVTVLIAEYRPFFVNGEVQKPGGFPYQPKLTVEQGIALAGGFTQRGSHSKIDVIRDSDVQRKAVRVQLTDPVFPGDIIIVKQSIF